MYRKKNREKQVEEVKISLEALVPENHILRAIDFSFIYEEVEGLYSEKGRPNIDSVCIFQIVFIQYLFGICSMRQTIRETVFIDSTHIKASANKYKSKEVKVTKPLKQYQLELEAVTRKVSTTDLDCGLFVKGEQCEKYLRAEKSLQCPILAP